MEGKALIASVVIMSVFLTQIQVDAKSCCPSTSARNIYNTCRFQGLSRPACVSVSGCKIITGSTCPSGYANDILENTAVNEYCKLGCVSSVCGALTSLKNSDESEIVNGTIEKCEKVCSTICTKNAKNAVENA